MDISVIVPEEYFGDIMGDLSRRRGQVKENELRSDGAQVVKAAVPLSEMFGYATDDHYAKTPKHIEEEIIKKRGFKLIDED